jgi:hypothetical protein
MREQVSLSFLTTFTKVLRRRVDAGIGSATRSPPHVAARAARRCRRVRRSDRRRNSRCPGGRSRRAGRHPVPAGGAPADAGGHAPRVHQLRQLRAPGSCTLAGGFNGRSNVSQMMVITRSNGRWTLPTKLRLPRTSPPNFTGMVSSISCTRVGSCVAVGSYGGARSRGFAASESHGTWRPAVQLRRPTNAGLKFSAFILDVACTGPGNCVAGGNYSEATGHHAPMVVTEVNGRWRRGIELRPPPNATIHQPVILTGLACPARGSCVAVGVYAQKGDRSAAFAATESGGTWHQAVQLIMPKDESTTSPLVFVNSVGCCGVGSCVVVGSYVISTGFLQPMSVAESGGAWARAQRVRHVPANAATGPRASLTFRSVSCLADGKCLAVAEYRIRGGGFGSTVMTKSGNTWVSAIQLRTPPDGATGRKQDASPGGSAAYPPASAQSGAPTGQPRSRPA